jgi:hypothetical protein
MTCATQKNVEAIDQIDNLLIPRKIENFSIKDAVKKRGKRTFYPFSNGV